MKIIHGYMNLYIAICIYMYILLFRIFRSIEMSETTTLPPLTVNEMPPSKYGQIKPEDCYARDPDLFDPEKWKPNNPQPRAVENVIYSKEDTVIPDGQPEFVLFCKPSILACLPIQEQWTKLITYKTPKVEKGGKVLGYTGLYKDAIQLTYVNVPHYIEDDDDTYHGLQYFPNIIFFPCGRTTKDGKTPNVMDDANDPEKFEENATKGIYPTMIPYPHDAENSVNKWCDWLNDKIIPYKEGTNFCHSPQWKVLTKVNFAPVSSSLNP